MKNDDPWKSVALMFVIGALIAPVACVRLYHPRKGSNEASAIASLKAICTGSAQFKDGGCVDLDGNKVGEFGFLEEMGGIKPCRTMKEGVLDIEGGQVFQASPYIPRVLGATEAFGDGRTFRSKKAGYFFVLYLPASEKSATCEYGSKVDLKLSEGSFIAYAWPQSAGRSGVRAFMIDFQGQPYSMANMGKKPFSGDDAPAWDAALNTSAWDSYIDEGAKGQAGMDAWVPTG